MLQHMCTKCGCLRGEIHFISPTSCQQMNGQPCQMVRAATLPALCTWETERKIPQAHIPGRRRTTKRTPSSDTLCPNNMRLMDKTPTMDIKTANKRWEAFALETTHKRKTQAKSDTRSPPNRIEGSGQHQEDRKLRVCDAKTVHCGTILCTRSCKT